MPSMYGSFHGPPSSGSDAMDAMRQMQLGLQHDSDFAARTQTMMRQDYERLQFGEAERAKLQHEIRESRRQTEQLRNTLTEIGREGGPVAKMQDEYRTYRGIMEEREDSYRRVWKQEEERVKNVSEDTKTRLKIVRDHLIGFVALRSPSAKISPAAADSHRIAQDARSGRCLKSVDA
jgi:hypothetical protein